MKLALVTALLAVVISLVLLVGALYRQPVPDDPVEPAPLRVPAQVKPPGPPQTVAPKNRATVTPDHWPQFRGNQAQTGFVAGHLPDQLQLAWRFQTEDDVKSSPVIQDGRVYIGSSDEHVYALELDTGKQLWRAAVDDMVEAAPAVIDGSVYVGTMNGTLYALDANDGAVRWTYATDNQVVGAVNWFRNDADRLSILVGSYDNLIHCVAADSGEVVWTHETEDYVNGSPAVGEGVCAFGGCNSQIRVLSLTDGSARNEVDSDSPVAASAAIHKGFAYAGTHGGELLKVPLAGTEVVWRYAADSDPFLASPAITDDVVVIGGGDGKVHCVDLETGKARWTFEALDTVDSSAAICGDKLVVGSFDGRLYMLRLDDGEKLWSYEVGQAILSSPAIAGGKVVVGCDDGVVYAFK
jgi:outer membrane protein assembly factor BamB